MKDPLSPLVIAVTGDFGTDRTHADLKRWIEANGGKWTSAITKDTTHLVCSNLHWKKRAAMVQKAQQHRDLKIVTYDWLEDSIMKRYRKREAPYLHIRLERKTARRSGQMKKKDARSTLQDEFRFREGCTLAKVQLQSENYHIYMDYTGFEYDIVLTRIDFKRNSNERYRLTLFESHSLPHTYAVSLQYLNAESLYHGETERVVPLGSYFHVAFEGFRKVFYEKSATYWENRLETPVPGLIATTNTQDVSKMVFPPPFIYFPPALNHPQGILPEMEIIYNWHEKSAGHR